MSTKLVYMRTESRISRHMKPSGTTDRTAADAVEPWLAVVRNQVRSLRFGEVQIVVHNGQVVQIERTEKIRLNEASRLAAEGSVQPREGI